MGNDMHIGTTGLPFCGPLPFHPYAIIVQKTKLGFVALDYSGFSRFINVHAGSGDRNPMFLKTGNGVLYASRSSIPSMIACKSDYIETSTSQSANITRWTTWGWKNSGKVSIPL